MIPPPCTEQFLRYNVQLVPCPGLPSGGRQEHAHSQRSVGTSGRSARVPKPEASGAKMRSMDGRFSESETLQVTGVPFGFRFKFHATRGPYSEKQPHVFRSSFMESCAGFSGIGRSGRIQSRHSDTLLGRYFHLVADMKVASYRLGASCYLLFCYFVLLFAIYMSICYFVLLPSPPPKHVTENEAKELGEGGEGHASCFCSCFSFGGLNGNPH